VAYLAGGIGASFRVSRDTARSEYRGGGAEPPARAPRLLRRPTGAGPQGEASARGCVEAWGRMTSRHVCPSSLPDCGARDGSQAGVARGRDESGGGRGILSRLRRWSRMRSMSAGCVMKPITRISLPQRGHTRGSTSYTRRINSAQRRRRAARYGPSGIAASSGAWSGEEGSAEAAAFLRLPRVALE
jgi:hypothetical protein